MANRLFFINISTDIAVAYDFDRTRQRSDDISLGSGAWHGGVASNNRLYFVDANGTSAVAYDFNGNRQSADDISLGTGFWGGAVASNNRLYFINDTTNTAVAYDFNGNRQSADDISLGTGTWRGGVASDDRLYFMADNINTARAYNFEGNRQSADDISLGFGAHGGVASNNRLFFINNRSNTAVAYDFNGSQQSSDNISLGSGNWESGTSIIESSAVITITTTDTNIEAGETVNFNIQSDIDISEFVAGDVTVTGGTRGRLTRTDAQNYVLSVVAGSAGTLRIAIAEDVVSPGNAAVSQDFTVNAVRADLSVNITGTTSIRQGQRTTLTAAVSEDSEVITAGLTYSWTASRGRFIGATNEASAVYEANFTDASDVEVTVTCAVRRAADTAPTSSGASLTALADIGVTGILVNMFMTALGAIASNSNNALYQAGSTGTLAAGSDQALSSDITIWRVRWNNDSNRIILNNNASGSLQTYFTANTDKSLYVIFEDGTYVELPQSQLVSTGTTWAQWSVTDANIVAKLNALTTTSDLLIGIADAGSIGIDANSGSGTATVTATPQPLPAPSVPASLSAAAIDHDSVRLSFSASTGTVTQYQYRYATSSGGLSSATWNDGGTGTTIDVDGLSPSTLYYFQVRALNQTEASAASNTARATTQAAPLPAPSTPGNFAATTVDHDTVRLTYSASTGTVTQYQYKYATSQAGLGSAVWTNGGTGTSIDVNGLSPSTQYYFQVRACNQTVYSAATSAVTATTQAAPLVAPSTPGSLSATVVNHNSVRLDFSASTGTVTQYQYKVATSQAGLASVAWNDGGTTTRITVGNLSPSTQYYFQVRACNQTAYSAASNTVNATTQAAPVGAVPVISAIDSPLDFIVDTPINFPIAISNNPYPVKLEGEIEELSYHWDASAGILYLRGTATRLRSNKELTIYASQNGNPSNVVSESFTYNVRNAAPVITEITAVQIVRGVAQSIFIPVTNNPGRAVVEGLLIGLDHAISRQDDVPGILITGTVPLDAEFTTNSGRFWMSVENDGGADTWGSRDSGGLAWTLTRASLPAQGSGLQASVNDRTVTLTWTAPADGGTPITGYEYQIDSGEWIPTLSTTARVVIENLQRRETAYQFRVRALNGLGAGPASSATSASIPPVVSLPTIGNIAASVRTTSATFRYIGIYFTSPINDGAAGSLTSLEYSLDDGNPISYLSNVQSTHDAYSVNRFFMNIINNSLGSTVNPRDFIITTAGQHTIRVRISNSVGTSQWSNLLTIQVP